MNLLYIPAEIYTPFNHKFSGGNVPWKGHPYYFKMYLTFFLQEQGINVSYLVNLQESKVFSFVFLSTFLFSLNLAGGAE